MFPASSLDLRCCWQACCFHIFTPTKICKHEKIDVIPLFPQPKQQKAVLRGDVCWLGIGFLSRRWIWSMVPIVASCRPSSIQSLAPASILPLVPWTMCDVVTGCVSCFQDAWVRQVWDVYPKCQQVRLGQVTSVCFLNGCVPCWRSCCFDNNWLKEDLHETFSKCFRAILRYTPWGFCLSIPFLPTIWLDYRVSQSYLGLFSYLLYIRRIPCIRILVPNKEWGACTGYTWTHFVPWIPLTV